MRFELVDLLILVLLNLNSDKFHHNNVDTVRFPLDRRTVNRSVGNSTVFDYLCSAVPPSFNISPQLLWAKESWTIYQATVACLA